jgi:hypothetical protein
LVADRELPEVVMAGFYSLIASMHIREWAGGYDPTTFEHFRSNTPLVASQIGATLPNRRPAKKKHSAPSDRRE